MTDGIRNRAVFIAGPTASGKSALALKLARETGGEIVNADALQVYADLWVLSARPTAADLAAAPHHLFGFLDGGERCSAGRWAIAAARAISDICARGAPAIVVGGTGLYFRALEEGLSPIPAAPEDVKTAARARLQAFGVDAFREEVIRADPGAARIAPGDRQRLLRSWEVFSATGRPLSVLQSAPREALLAPVARIVLEPDRETLYGACERRFERMLAEGALEEARRLRDRGLSRDLPVMKALGASELIAHLDGAMSLEAASELARRNTRRFVKRQLTWFRNQTPLWPRAESPDAALAALRPAMQK